MAVGIVLLNMNNISESLVPAEQSVTTFVIVASDVFWSLRKIEKTPYSGFKTFNILVFKLFKQLREIF